MPHRFVILSEESWILRVKKVQLITSDQQGRMDLTLWIGVSEEAASNQQADD
ncbi:MAG: hypothetical protein KDN20_11335 [Verrucomicrobiae bacterium]|nr:hypothetical protein [Verrucomicrobiae bacterium]